VQTLRGALGYVHDPAKERMRREEMKQERSEEKAREPFAMRDELLMESGMEGNAEVNATRDYLGYGSAPAAAAVASSPYAYKNDDDWDDDDYDHTPVDFLRPDGDIEAHRREGRSMVSGQ